MGFSRAMVFDGVKDGFIGDSEFFGGEIGPGELMETPGRIIRVSREILFNDRSAFFFAKMLS